MAKREIGDSFSPLQRSRFIASLSEYGIVKVACEYAKVTATVVYKLREVDADFARQWAEALELAGDELEKEARRRAVKGVTRVAISGGKVVTDAAGKTIKVTEFSDRLLEKLLAGARPDKYGLPGNGSRTPARPADLMPDPEPTPDEPTPADVP